MVKFTLPLFLQGLQRSALATRRERPLGAVGIEKRVSL